MSAPQLSPPLPVGPVATRPSPRAGSRLLAALAACWLAACGPPLEEDAEDSADAGAATVYARGVDYSWARPGAAAIAWLAAGLVLTLAYAAVLRRTPVLHVAVISR